MKHTFGCDDVAFVRSNYAFFGELYARWFHFCEFFQTSDILCLHRSSTYPKNVPSLYVYILTCREGCLIEGQTGMKLRIARRNSPNALESDLD